MRKITISLHKKDSPFVFYVILRPHWSYCYCKYYGKPYTFSIRLNSNSVFYINFQFKNLFGCFPGMFARRWSIWLNDENNNTIAHISKKKESFDFHYDKKYNELAFKDLKKKTKKVKAEQNDSADKDLAYYKTLLSKVIAENQVLYEKIKDKNTFNEQIENYFFSEASDKDDKTIADIKKYMHNYINAELSFDYLKKNITIKLLRERFHTLKNASDELINEIIDLYLTKDEFEEPYINIFFEDDKKDQLENYISIIANRVLSEIESNKSKDIHKKYTVEKVERIFFDKIKRIVDKEYLLNCLKTHLSNDKSKTEKELLIGLDVFFAEFLFLEDLYNKIIAAYGDSSVHLVLTDNKLIRFDAYTNGQGVLDSKEKAEYDLIYRPAIPHINKILYENESDTINNIFKNMPLFYEYFLKLLKWFFEQGILYEKDNYIYCGELEKINLLPRNLQLFSSYFGKIMSDKKKSST